MDTKSIEIVIKISLLLVFNMTYNYINKDYILFNSVASVHVFYIKEKFSKFRKLTKAQSLLCKSDLISIKGWRKISLLLKNED